MTMPLKPQRGGFKRPFGCAWFIREYLAGNGPAGAAELDPARGAPQTDIFSAYKDAIIRARAENQVAKEEERLIKKGLPPLSTAAAEAFLQAIIEKTPVRSTGMTYHSFAVYFGTLKRLNWVEETGETEPSTFQEHYEPGPPRVFYRLTDAGQAATEEMLADPTKYFYGYGTTERSPKKGGKA